MNQTNGTSGEQRPRRFGRYTIVRKLGGGAFGSVYEAVREDFGKRVALKILHPHWIADEMQRARFVQEARTAALVKHPHIVEVEDIGVVGDEPYIAMEFLVGETLSQRIKRQGRLSHEDALDVALPVLSAVSAMHERGIVHRDIKPENIFLWAATARHVHPKVLDFGIAKENGNEGDKALTRSGLILGSPAYMAPELVDGSKHATTKSDQWALGVTLFESLSGRYPYDAKSLIDLFTRLCREPPTHLLECAPWVPEGLAHAVMRSLERDPSARHPHVSDLARAILPFSGASARARWGTEFADTSSVSPDPASDVPATPASFGHAEPHVGNSSVSPAENRSHPVTILSESPSPLPYHEAQILVARSPTDAGERRSEPATQTPSRSMRTLALGGFASSLVVVGVLGGTLVIRSTAALEHTETVPTTLRASSRRGPSVPTSGTSPVAAEASRSEAPTRSGAANDALVARPDTHPVEPSPTAASASPTGGAPSAAPAAPPGERRAMSQPPPTSEPPTPRRVSPPSTPPGNRPPPGQEPQDPRASPMEHVQLCRVDEREASERNACILRALAGRARSQNEIALLASTYQAAGRPSDAVSAMQGYVQRWPEGPLADEFRRYINAHQ